MRTYILIGGIGSGKSTVAAILRDMGATCIDLDLVGHDVLRLSDTVCELVEAFGEGILEPDGEVDRRALAAKAFATPDATSTLNSITQPRIVQRAIEMLEDLREEGCPLAVVEISPFDGPEGVFAPIVRISTGIVAVIAPLESRVRRAVERGFGEADVRSRIAQQATDDQRRQWADIVLVNDEDIDTLRHQVEHIVHDLS